MTNWPERNQQWLVATMARLRGRIDACAAEAAYQERTDSVSEVPQDFTPALLHCTNVFELSPFERELLLLVAALDLDHGVRRSVRAMNNGNAQITFAFALAALTQPHWDALSPDAPLRRWRLIELEPGWPLAQAPLRIDERVLHFIAGVDSTDVLLRMSVPRATASQEARHADQDLVRRIINGLMNGRIVVLHNDPVDLAELRDAAMAASAGLGSQVFWINARDLPLNPAEQLEVAIRIDREVLLTRALPVLIVESGDEARGAISLLARMATPVLWLGVPAAGSLSAPQHFRVTRIELPCRHAEFDARLNGAAADVHRVSRQFRLSRAALDEIIDHAEMLEPDQRASAMWLAAREAARGGLDALAQRIVTTASFDDLVLPQAQLNALRDIARHLRQRDRVYREWGFAEKHTRGQGLTALFSGESGTGKTLAAEAIANEVELDLYRVDLATVVSKYIGETEKNLKHVFDAAEASGAVLLFDEADALFGKRSEVKDSHDRYANIEVAYLLQRVEAYRGLAILTTNMKTALDRAFLRRIRFVIHFPFPDAAAREQIWRRQFPPRAPLGDVDFSSLATLNLSGGHINSIALSAAFNAADRAVAIDQSALLDAARAEFAKLERTFVAPQRAP